MYYEWSKLYAKAQLNWDEEEDICIIIMVAI